MYKKQQTIIVSKIVRFLSRLKL